MYSAFQSNGFQNSAFQIITAAPAAEHYSGGYPVPKEKKKFDSESYAEIYNRADMLRTRIEALPEPVQEVIESVLEEPVQANREAEIARQLKSVERKFLRVYIALMERYRAAYIEAEIARQMEWLRIQEEDEALLLLLLSC